MPPSLPQTGHPQPHPATAPPHFPRSGGLPQTQGPAVDSERWQGGRAGWEHLRHRTHPPGTTARSRAGAEITRWCHVRSSIACYSPYRPYGDRRECERVLPTDLRRASVPPRKWLTARLFCCEGLTQKAEAWSKERPTFRCRPHHGGPIRARQQRSRPMQLPCHGARPTVQRRPGACRHNRVPTREHGPPSSQSAGATATMRADQPQCTEPSPLTD